MIVFRPIEPRDYDAVRQLLIENGWGTRVSDDAQFHAMIEGANRTVVAVDGERIIGFARALCDEATNGYISTVAVAEDRRSEGVGRSLVENLIAKDDGKITWVLRARPDSRAFWERMGFTASEMAMEKLRR
jgi:N-acetylglutamate synthase-like GNAT family acetyltransferase